MDDDELAQLQEAYQKTRTLVPPDLQRELELRTHSREAKPKNAIQDGPYTTTNGIPEQECMDTRDKSQRPQRLPYNWGKFQGWVMLIAGPFVALASDRWLAVVTAPLYIASGYAFARRKKYAVAMTYLWIVLVSVSSVFGIASGFSNELLTPKQKGEEVGRSIAQLLIGLVFWGSCALYYSRRRSEFSH